MSAFSRVVAMILAVAIPAFSQSGYLASTTDDERAFVKWAQQNAIPLKTVEARNGFDDMEPIGTIVGDARIVALGEATHGTREFFQLKHRMVEYLATRKGFTVFAIEANMPEAYRINDYVLRGEGDPKELLKGLYFWTWNTQEVLDMILWMREFNRSGKGHIEFAGFDMQTPTVAADIVKEFVQQHETAYLPTVEAAYKGVGQSKVSGPPFGVGTASFPVSSVVGKHITYSGYIRTENVDHGFAGLWWRVDGEPKSPPLAFDNMQGRGATGTTDWKRYEISLDVPANASNINFGVLHTGSGKAWFDSLKVEINGTPYSDSSAFDLDFESAFPRGFYTGGAGYQVGIDKTIAHTRKQSLKSAALPSVSDKNEVQAKCEGVLSHLETHRDQFVKAISPQEVDWVIQNARVVAQSAQLATGKKSRDESMAENVKWIADHSGGAKLILWAHNGHVTHGPIAGYTPMGAYLRKMFGSEYRDFGFAFNEGSFRAVETGKAMREWTVAPAMTGSLDQALSAVHMPVFALDLRRVPPDHAAAEWFAEPHRTRSVGAVYSEGNENSYYLNTPIREDFDALLFVQKTTASHGN